MSQATTAVKPQLFAHRGTSLMAPENTRAAFDFALHYHADVLETDVRLSKDNVVMVTHDETLHRTTNGSGRVKDYRAIELQNLDASCRFRHLSGSRYQGTTQRLLTLDELLQLYPTVGINIDIKDNEPRAVQAVADTIKRHQRRNSHKQWINIGSFHAAVTHQFRQLMPQISTAATRQEVARLVFGSMASKPIGYQVLQIPLSYWGIQLHGNRLINKVHKANCKIIYWTINNPLKINHLLSKSADGIVTDRPDLALLEFERMGLKNPSQQR